MSTMHAMRWQIAKNAQFMQGGTWATLKLMSFKVETLTTLRLDIMPDI